MQPPMKGTSMERPSTGIDALDELLGGLGVGDNVVWQASDPAEIEPFVEAFLATANGSYAYDNPGFGRIRYPKDHTEPNGCGALVKLEGGAFQVARSMKCFDNVPLK